MKKYIISIVASLKKYDAVTQGGASMKAPADIEQIVTKQGYGRIEIFVYGSKVRQYLCLLRQLFCCAFRLERGSCLLFQYPLISPWLLILLLPIYKKFYLQLLIHDINSLRIKGFLSQLEKRVLGYFDRLIVHTIAMKEILEQSLPDKEYGVLGYFPYCAIPEESKRHFGRVICFAGNLYKSSSITKIFGATSHITLFLYAKERFDSGINENIVYKGAFNPHFIHGIEGNWGLIWDGNDENDTDCWRNYTRINAPHKFSLYVMAHLPVIVWEKSAIASVVKQRQIGFTIASLQEMESKIMQITPEQYEKFMDNIIRFSEEVASGKNVLEAIR